MANLTKDTAMNLDLTLTKDKVGIAAGAQAFIGGLTLVDADGYFDPDNGVRCLGFNDDPPSAAYSYDNRSGVDGALDVYYRTNCPVFITLDETNPPDDSMRGCPLYASDDNHVSICADDGPYVGWLIKVDTKARVMLDPADSPSGSGVYAGMSGVQTLAAATEIVFEPGKKSHQVKATTSGGGIVLTADLPTALPGEERRIVGTDDSDYPIFSSAISNLSLYGAANCEVKDGDTLDILGLADGSWREVGRCVG